jgi:hypothetical protein
MFYPANNYRELDKSDNQTIDSFPLACTRKRGQLASKFGAMPWGSKISFLKYNVHKLFFFFRRNNVQKLRIKKRTCLLRIQKGIFIQKLTEPPETDIM